MMARSVASESLRYSRGQRAALSALLILAILDIGLSVLMPWPLKLIADNVLSDREFTGSVAWITLLPGAGAARGQLAWLVAGIFILFFGRQILKIVRNYLQAGATSRLKNDLAGDVFAHLQALPLGFHSWHKAGDLVRRVRKDTDFIRVFVAKVFLPAFIAVGTLVAMLSIMWTLNPALSMVAMLTALPLPFLIKWLTPKMSEHAYAYNRAEGDLLAVAEQAITALPVIQLYGQERREEQRFKDVSKRAVHTNLRSTVAGLKFSIAVGAVTALGTAAMMALGGFQVLQGSLTVGGLLVFLSYLASTYEPMETLSGMMGQYATSKGQAQRVFEILDTAPEPGSEFSTRNAAASANMAALTLTFDNVSFGYKEGQPILENVSFSVPPGHSLALVGATGAGKSTIAALAARFYDPWKGRILINGADIRGMGLESLRDQIGMVMQESFLLPLTVAENIAYGRPEASRAEIIAAAEAASASEFINALPDGFDTVIHERGANLSGGQCQRLSIARAFLKNAPLLILDEPTSALDAKTESVIVDALKRLAVGRTTITITHRLSTIRNADIIAVLSNNTIAAAGTHEELLTTSSYYRELCELNQQPG